MFKNFNKNNSKQDHLQSGQDDLKLWNQISSGDVNSFSTLFNNYYNPLYIYAYRFVKDISAAENIVQEVFVFLWTKREKIQIKYSLKSYLYTAVRNHSLNHLKQQSFTESLDEKPDLHNKSIHSPEDEFIKKEFHLKVQEAIGQLPEKCRQIYLMNRYDNLKYREIAEILGISVNTVKTQLNRALKSLLKYLNSFTIF